MIISNCHQCSCFAKLVDGYFCKVCFAQDQELVEKVRTATTNTKMSFDEICSNFDVSIDRIIFWIERGALPRTNIRIRCFNCGQWLEDCSCDRIIKSQIKNFDNKGYRLHNLPSTLRSRIKSYEEDTEQKKIRNRYFTPNVGINKKK